MKNWRLGTNGLKGLCGRGIHKVPPPMAGNLQRGSFKGGEKKNLGTEIFQKGGIAIRSAQLLVCPKWPLHALVKEKIDCSDWKSWQLTAQFL